VIELNKVLAAVQATINPSSLTHPAKLFDLKPREKALYGNIIDILTEANPVDEDPIRIMQAVNYSVDGADDDGFPSDAANRFELNDNESDTMHAIRDLLCKDYY
jgi:hypothetical protein